MPWGKFSAQGPADVFLDSFQVHTGLEYQNVEWDFEGTGGYPAATPTNNPFLNGLTMKHTFTKPGTYFATVRVTSQREGDTSTPFTRVQNLDRVRVVVTG